MPEQDHPADEGRRDVVRTSLLKAGAVLAAIAVFVWLASTVLVRSLGLGGEDATTAADPAASPDAPLPTTALPVPSPGADPTEEPTATPTPEEAPGGFRLTASPTQVSPGQRIDLSGRYGRKSGLNVDVQRLESGSWQSFAGVDAAVRGGSFRTWVQTSRLGEHQFRVYDAGSGKASNPVTVTVS